jgi:DHA3 family macrolide efflux protein-like MFS transporter
MVPKKHLARVQGVNQTLNGGMNVIAAPLGALLLAVLPMQGILAIDVVTALIAVVPLFFFAIPQPEKKVTVEGKESSFWEDFRAGLRYVFGWKGLFLTLLMTTAINFLLTPAGTLTPLLVSNFFAGGAKELAWFEASFSIGVIAGGVLLGVWGGFKRQIATAMLGLIGIGVFIFVVGIVPATGFATAVAAMFFVGVAVPITNGSLGAIFQTAVEPGMQGRVFTIINSVASGATPVSLILAGPLADKLGVQSWYVTGGVLCTLMGIAGFFIPAVMKIEEGRPVDRKTAPRLAAE